MKRSLSHLLPFLFAGFFFCVVFYILKPLASDQPFLHDEAIYLAKARMWLKGVPADAWGVYRPVGLSLVGWVILQYTQSEQIVRLWGVLMGAATISALFLFFRRLTNIWVALAATTIIASSYLFLREAPQFLDDIPAAGFLVGMLYCLSCHYEDTNKSNCIYFAAPLAALAFYLRYGSILPLAVIGVVTVIIYRSKDVRKEGSALLITFILFLPHFIQAQITTGSLTGILTAARSIAHAPSYFGEAFIDYLQWLPRETYPAASPLNRTVPRQFVPCGSPYSELGGVLMGAAVIMGVISLLFIVTRPALRTRYRGIVWLGLIGAFTFLLISLAVHAEPRYVFLPLALLTCVGAAGVFNALAKYTQIGAKLSMLLMILVALLMAQRHYYLAERFAFAWKKSVAYPAYSKIAKDVHGRSCVVWSALLQPATSWYTECRTPSVLTYEHLYRDLAKYTNHALYSIAFTSLPNSQLLPKDPNLQGVRFTEIYRRKAVSLSCKYPKGDLIIYRMETKFHKER